MPIKNVKPKVVASIEARMGSSRLPGKVLMNIGDISVIKLLVTRLQMCQTLDDIIIATTVDQEDEPLVKWCQDNGIKYYRGSQDNVLNRVVNAHKSVSSDIIVEITGDCPFTDPQVVDLGVETFLQNECDFLTNCEKSNFIEGIYVQIFTYKSLEHVDKTINDPAVKEHVSLYFYDHPESYKTIHLMALNSWKLDNKCRTQLDYPEDLLFLNSLMSKLNPKFGYAFTTEDIIGVLNADPALLKINNHCEEKEVR